MNIFNKLYLMCNYAFLPYSFKMFLNKINHLIRNKDIKLLLDYLNRVNIVIFECINEKEELLLLKTIDNLKNILDTDERILDKFYTGKLTCINNTIIWYNNKSIVRIDWFFNDIQYGNYWLY